MEPILILAELAVILYLIRENRELKTNIPQRDRSGKFAPKPVKHKLPIKPFIG